MARTLNTEYRVSGRSATGAAWLCVGVLLVLAVLSLMLGTVPLTPARMAQAIVMPGADPAAAAIVRNLRLPRLLLALVAGALVGMGAVLLGRVSRQAARDPGWSGVMALGAFGAVGLLASEPARPWWALHLAVGAGCGVGAALLMLAAQRWPTRPGRAQAIGLLLALGAPLLAFALLIGEVRVATWVRWCLGSLEQRDWANWRAALPLTALATATVAASLVWPERRWLTLLGAALSAATATVCAGALGLIGLCAGRWATTLSEKERDRLLLAGLLGATMLSGADLAARGLTATLPSLGLISELPVGALLVVASLGSFIIARLRPVSREY